MELSEGKLFTIEALNRIEGFEWPEWANYASMCRGGGYHWFWSDKPIDSGDMFSAAGMVNAVLIGSDHPDWRNSLITRAEFESVDGWVRDSRYPKSMNIEKIQQSSGGYKWHYKKPRNQPEKAADTSPTHSIETLICQHKAARAATLKARLLLEQAEAFEHNLLLAIEVWAESNGFDIRVLDEVKK